MNTDDPVVEAVVPELEEHIRQVMADQRVVGATVGIVRDQALAWTGSFGWADLDEPRPADERTLYRVDSNTKPVTAVAIMQLRDAGKLQLGAPLVDYLPEFAKVDAREGALEDVTLQRLLTHRSGLNGEVPGDWSVTGVGPNIEEVLSRLDECAIVIPPDSQHKYCNLGFILLGEVVARVSGQRYEDYVREHIIDPLGMTATTFDPESSELPRAAQYGWSSVTARPAESMQLTHNGRNAAGGLYSTVGDMAKWISLQFRTGRKRQREGAQVLAGASIEEMHRPRYAEPDWQSAQCLAWRGIRSGEHVYLGHGGGNPGSQSFTLFNAATRTGAVVLTNSDGHSAQLQLARDAMDRLMAAQDTQPRPTPSAPPSPVPERFAPLLGRYESARGAIARIAWVDGDLAFLGPGVGVPREVDWMADPPTCLLDATASDFVLKARDGRLAGETLTFDTNSDGVIIDLRVQTGAVYRKLVPAE